MFTYTTPEKGFTKRPSYHLIHKMFDVFALGWSRWVQVKHLRLWRKARWMSGPLITCNYDKSKVSGQVERQLWYLCRRRRHQREIAMHMPFLKHRLFCVHTCLKHNLLYLCVFHSWMKFRFFTSENFECKFFMSTLFLKNMNFFYRFH